MWVCIVVAVVQVIPREKCAQHADSQPDMDGKLAGS